MISGEAQPRVKPLLTCAHCGQVIGVYELLMHVIGGPARRTSRAAEPGIVSTPGKCYHLACYEPPSSSD